MGYKKRRKKDGMPKKHDQKKYIGTHEGPNVEKRIWTHEGPRKKIYIQ